MGVPTTWQSRMVVVAKKSGKPRRTVDLSPLNKHCLRETQVSGVEPGTFKSVLDAWNSYHAVELEEESRNLTSFINPFGRYRYRRAEKKVVSSSFNNTTGRHWASLDQGTPTP